MSGIVSGDGRDSDTANGKAAGITETGISAHNWMAARIVGWSVVVLPPSATYAYCAMTAYGLTLFSLSDDVTVSYLPALIVATLMLGAAVWLGVMWLSWKSMGSRYRFRKRVLLTLLVAWTGLLGVFIVTGILLSLLKVVFPSPA